MPEAEQTNNVEALKRLQADSRRLEKIREASERFNVFEAIGFVDQEIRHSRFLAHLMDPEANHGLGDAFTRKFLLSAMDYEGAPVSLEELKKADLSRVEVTREYKHVDILLEVEILNLVVIVENKVWATEQPGQLDRYYRAISDERPGRMVAGIYMSPFGAAPSHEEYHPLDYGTICQKIDDLLEDQTLLMGGNVRTALEQYNEMFRRNILTDSEVHRLSRELYRDHGQAINLVLKSLLGSQDAIHKLLKSLIDDAKEFSYGYTDTEELDQWLVFDRVGWGSSALDSGKAYRGSNRMLYFVFLSDLAGEIELWLELGPGDQSVRERIMAMAQEHSGTFPTPPDPAEEFTGLYKKTMLSADESQQEDTSKKIRERWREFFQDDLPAMDAHLKEAGLI